VHLTALRSSVGPCQAVGIGSRRSWLLAPLPLSELFIEVFIFSLDCTGRQIRVTDGRHRSSVAWKILSAASVSKKPVTDEHNDDIVLASRIFLSKEDS
jgi:hypothetical protein